MSQRIRVLVAVVAATGLAWFVRGQLAAAQRRVGEGRARAEAAVERLRASEERFRTLADTIPSIVWTAAPDGTITYANERWFHYCDLTQAENTRDWPQLVLHPDDMERYAALWTSALREGIHFEIEVRHRRNDGEYRWLLTRALPVRDAAGRVTAWFGTTTDIHERKQAEAERERLLAAERVAVAAVRASEERLRLALAAGAMGTWDWEPATGRLVWSKEVEALYGLAPGTFDGTYETYWGLIHPGDRASVDVTIAGAAEHDGDFTVEHRVVWPDGTVRWLVGQGHAYLDESGRLVQMAGTVMDVTARHLAEAERERLLAAEQEARVVAEAAVRIRDGVLAAAAHDLKTPLAGIKAVAQLVRRQLEQAETAGSERMMRGLARIDGSATQMASQIDELLDLAQLLMGEALVLDRQPTDLVALVRRVAAEQQAAIERHQVRIDADGPALVGDWDTARLARVVQNLVGNAVKYSPEGGEITIAVARVDDGASPWAVLTVRDHGLGIPAADQPFIFERFRRGANVPERVAGTGIGLASARQIVEQHGGCIAVESQEGAGSTFTVRLPLGEPEAACAGTAES